MLFFWTFYSPRNLKTILLSCIHIILKNVFCESNKNIRIISEGSCDGSDYAKNAALNHSNKWQFKYIHIEYSIELNSKIKIFQNVTVFAVHQIKKMLAWWLEETSLKNITNITVYKYLTGSVQLKREWEFAYWPGMFTHTRN